MWPIFVDTNSDFNWNGASDYAIYAPTPGDWYHIVMTYTASNQTMVTTMTNFEQTSGVTIIDPLDLTSPVAPFTDFRVDTVSINSYQDDGFGDSIYAQGVLANFVVTLPPPPIQNLAGALQQRGLAGAILQPEQLALHFGAHVRFPIVDEPLPGNSRQRDQPVFAGPQPAGGQGVLPRERQQAVNLTRQQAEARSGACGVHAHRTAGRHCHHRDSRGDVAAGVDPKQVVRARREVREQFAPAWSRGGIILGRQRRKLFPVMSLAPTNYGAIYWFGWLGPGPEGQRPFDLSYWRALSVSQRQRGAALPVAGICARAIQAEG